MRCSQAEHLLSLNLDGRLASGQRRTLTDHLAACTDCRKLDRELSAARELALSLPAQRVSEGFREELWQRIRAGEGTPDAVFREPVPLMSKVRYFATGAAAAGLLILASNFLRSKAPAPHAEPATEVAKSTSPTAPPRLVRRGSVQDLDTVVPATPAQLADLVSNGYADAVRTLHASAADLQQPSVPGERVQRLRDQADQASRFAGLLRWMVDRNYLRLTDDDVKSLTAIEVVAQQVGDFQDAESLRRVLRPIHGMAVDQPRNYFCNPCVEDERGFVQEFLTRIQTSRLDRALATRIQIVTLPTPGGPEQVQVFVVR